MTRALSQDLLWYGYWKRKLVTITIIPNPADATVVLTCAGYSQSGNSITVPIGATLSWSVSKSPSYHSKSDIFVVTGPNTINVELSSAPTGTLSINPVPSDSVVTLTATGYTQVGNAITVPLGVTVHCTISPNNGVDLLESSRDIQVVEQGTKTETLTCNARVTISPDPADSVANITYAGRTYANTAIVPYDSRISWSVSHVNYDSQTGQNVQILANTPIPVVLQKTRVTVSVTPYIKGTLASNATVALSTNASGISPVSGKGKQQISVPIGSSVTYTVSQTNYDTVTGVIENITTATNTSVPLVAHNMGVLYYTSNTSWTVPTNDNYKMAVITNGGAGGSCNSAKQFGGMGGGASGNTYVVDLSNLTAGDILRFTFGSNNTVITKNNADYLSYPNGANGASSSVTSMSFNGTNGGAATNGNGGGGGSGGCRTYTVSIPHTTCGTGRQASCRTTYSYTTYRGIIAASGAGGAGGNSGANGGTSTVIGSTYATAGTGGTGFNSSRGGASNGVNYGTESASTGTAGTGGYGGTGASSYQSTITSKIQAGTLTSAILRSYITGGGGGTGGVFGASGDYAATTTVSTPGAGGGGGAWYNGSNGANGVASTTGNAFSTRTGGAGGHGVIIIWRPSDYTGS